MAENFFKEVDLPQFQKNDRNGVVFPAVLFPNVNKDINNYSLMHQLSHLTEAIKAHKPWLESLLSRSGAILFRGFPSTSPSDFNEIVEAFDYPEMPYTGGGALRTQVVGRVFTANEGPPHQRIHFHNEMAYASEFPTKLFFFCEVEPGSGGETAIVQGDVIYDKIKETHPEFVEQLEEHGLIYVRHLPHEDDLSSHNGRFWKSTFSADDKSIAEQRAAKMGMTLEWTKKCVYVKTYRPAIKFDNANQQKIWFNRLAGAYTNNREDEDYDPNKFVTFGDGVPVRRKRISETRLPQTQLYHEKYLVHISVNFLLGFFFFVGHLWHAGRARCHGSWCNSKHQFNLGGRCFSSSTD